MENTGEFQSDVEEDSSSCSSLRCFPSTSATIATDSPGPESDVTELGRLVADAIKISVSELRKDNELAMSQFVNTFRAEFSAFREGEEKLIGRLNKAITALNPQPKSVDPVENFWTVYRKVADEHDSDMVAKYLGDLDTSLLFAGLFSAVSATFIAQILPSMQPDPSNLTNELLLRILQRNASFNGVDPLAPINNVPISVIRAQTILFASLVVSLFAAFIAVLGKQWILYYTRNTTWGSVVDRGKERQLKFVGLQKWGLHLIMESLPVMLQFSLFLFSTGIVVYLWDLDISAAEVVLLVTCVSCAFYLCITVFAVVWKDCPFQTPFSILLPKFLVTAKQTAKLVRSRLGRGLRWFTALLRRVESPAARGRKSDVGSLDPALWRREPLFTPPLPEDPSASAGFWLLENSTGRWAATAVASAFQEFQWPSHYRSTTALVRLRDTYAQCLRPDKFGQSSQFKALQCAGAYYVLYHTQVLWNNAKGLEVEVKKLPPDLPPDLLLSKTTTEQWDQCGLYQYLLNVKDRSEPVTSARFLSYIAPYWYCDREESAGFRHLRLEQGMNDLIQVLEDSRQLNKATITDCLLCVGAAMDFPLHPEDLVRVDKSDYVELTFKSVVEHVLGIALGGSRGTKDPELALRTILILAKKPSFPRIEVVWVDKLLSDALKGEVNIKILAQLLRLRGLAIGRGQAIGRDLEEVVVVVSVPLTPEDNLFNAIWRAIDGNQGWGDEVVYGGLTVIKEMVQLGSYLPHPNFLKTLSDAMSWVNSSRVKRAACDVMQVAQDGWLGSASLRQSLVDHDLPRRLSSVIQEIHCVNRERKFLGMIEILSNDKQRHSYLRKTMSTWICFRHLPGRRLQAARIIATIGGIPFPEVDFPDDFSLINLVKEEWTRVPGRGVKDLTPNRLMQLAGVTKQLKHILFDEVDRKEVLAEVKQVIPHLERRLDFRQVEDIRGIVEGLIRTLSVYRSFSWS